VAIQRERDIMTDIIKEAEEWLKENAAQGRITASALTVIRTLLERVKELENKYNGAFKRCEFLLEERGKLEHRLAKAEKVVKAGEVLLNEEGYLVLDSPYAKELQQALAEYEEKDNASTN